MRAARVLMLVLVLTATSLCAKGAAQPDTVWEGVVYLEGAIEVPFVLHVVDPGDGPPRAALDIPDEGAKGLKVDTVTIKPESLSFTMEALQAEFTGVLDAKGTKAVGEWKQSGLSWALTLRKTDRPTERRRPQTPKPPFPYREEALTYENKDGCVTLAGTLTIPRGVGPFPAAILISGSGPNDRDETYREHKPFLVLADHLTRLGIAVLRVDDRGIGGSSGNVASSTILDFAGDVLAGVALLKGRPDIDPKAIGLIGHSEGGNVAALVAARSSDVAFIVLMAGTGLPGDEIVTGQLSKYLNAMGAGEEYRERCVRTRRRLLAVVKTEKDDQRAKEAILAIVQETRDTVPEPQRNEFERAMRLFNAEIATLISPGFRFFLSYDPRPGLADVLCPVLAVNGANDLQVASAENLAAVEKALRSGGNDRVTIKELPRLNHLFQTSPTGVPAEYGRIDETLAASVLGLIGDWIAEQVGSRKRTAALSAQGVLTTRPSR